MKKKKRKIRFDRLLLLICGLAVLLQLGTVAVNRLCEVYVDFGNAAYQNYLDYMERTTIK